MKSIRYIIAIGLGATAYAATPITTCQTIAASGNYSLEADLASATNCIVINASNVTLALNGHSITGSSGTGAGVAVNTTTSRVDHVGVSGPGLVKGFGNGILILLSDYVQVSGVTSIGNTTNGISVNTSTFVTVASNMLAQNGVWGLLMTSTNSSVQGNEMPGNGFGPGNHPAGGLRVSGSLYTLTGNLTPGNGKLAANTNTQNAGMIINASNSRISGNVSDGGNGNGIEVLAGALGNVIGSNNKAIGNLGTDLVDDNANCGTNLWADNTFFTRNPASCVK